MSDESDQMSDPQPICRACTTEVCWGHHQGNEMSLFYKN